MFNRGFFERDFARLIDAYARDRKSSAPVVEIHLRDGGHFLVESIELVGEDWLSFRIAPDPDLGGRPDGRRHADQVTCPYNAILRVDFLPHLAEKKVGFRMSR